MAENGSSVGIENLDSGFEAAKQQILHVKEAYIPKDQIILTAEQSYQAVGLAVDNPFVNDSERAEFERRSIYSFSNDKGPRESALGIGDRILAKGAQGVVDLLRDMPDPDTVPKDWLLALPKKSTIDKRVNEGGFLKRRERNRRGMKVSKVVDLDAAVFRIEQSTDFAILGKEIFEHPELMPVELQYAFGIASEEPETREAVWKIKERLEGGDKLALMQIKKLPSDEHKALQVVIQSMKGSVADAMAYILDGKTEHLKNIDPAHRPIVEQAAETAREGARKLIHFKLLTKDPPNEEVKNIEQTINGIIDGNIDIPYAYWKYKVDAFRDDLRMSAASLGLGTAVAVGLMAVGFGGNANSFEKMIKEGFEEGVPATIADTSMNFSAAFSESEKGKTILERTRQTFKLLADKYKFAVGVGVACSIGLGVFSKFLETQTDSQLLASLPLAFTAIGPTLVTKWSTERLKKNKLATENGSHAADQNPIHDSLVTSSLVGAGATVGVGALHLLDSAVAVTGATEIVEPLTILALAAKKLNDSRTRYFQIMSQKKESYMNFMRNGQPNKVENRLEKVRKFLRDSVRIKRFVNQVPISPKVVMR